MPKLVGNLFKDTRIAKGLSLEEASKATHIRLYYLQALEDDRFEDIPSQPQIKGFLRLYADWLSLDSQEILKIYTTSDSQSEPIDQSAKNLEDKKVSPDIEEEKSQTQKSGITIKRKKKSGDENANNKSENSTDDIAANSLSVSTKENEESILETDSQPEVAELAKVDTYSSQDLFNQIGEELRECRQKLSISVDDIEKLTHIRARYLVAMESGNFNEIPSLVQARGLLSGYTSFLNLDSDKLLNTFAEALQQRRLELIPPQSETKVKNNKNSSRKKTERLGLRRILNFDFLAGTIAIIGLVLVVIYSTINVLSTNKKEVIAPPPISEVLMENPTSEASFNTTPTIQTTGIVRNPESIGQLPTENSINANTTDIGSPTPPVPDLGNAAMQVYIVPNQRVFLQVTVGKKVAFLGRTVPGNAYPFTSDERIEIISGNAAALQIYYNQRDLGTLGLQGQPLRLVFSKDGISTPTAMVTQVPTSTRMPTLTLKPTSTQIPPTVTPLIP